MTLATLAVTLAYSAPLQTAAPTRTITAMNQPIATTPELSVFGLTAANLTHDTTFVTATEVRRALTISLGGAQYQKDFSTTDAILGCWTNRFTSRLQALTGAPVVAKTPVIFTDPTEIAGFTMGGRWRADTGVAVGVTSWTDSVAARVANAVLGNEPSQNLTDGNFLSRATLSASGVNPAVGLQTGAAAAVGPVFSASVVGSHVGSPAILTDGLAAANASRFTMLTAVPSTYTTDGLGVLSGTVLPIVTAHSMTAISSAAPTARLFIDGTLVATGNGGAGSPTGFTFLNAFGLGSAVASSIAEYIHAPTGVVWDATALAGLDAYYKGFYGIGLF